MRGSGSARSTLTRTSVVPAPAEQVWARVTDFEGINHELMPYLRMRVPRRHADRTVADITPGEALGKVWILYLGLLPLDWDDLVIAELEHGRRFQERSTMASMRVWEHERIVEPLDDSTCEVTDNVAYVPRLPLRPARRFLAWFLGRVFTHRHRRLVGHFGG